MVDEYLRYDEKKKKFKIVRRTFYVDTEYQTLGYVGIEEACLLWIKKKYDLYSDYEKNMLREYAKKSGIVKEITKEFYHSDDIERFPDDIHDYIYNNMVLFVTDTKTENGKMIAEIDIKQFVFLKDHDGNIFYMKLKDFFNTTWDL